MLLVQKFLENHTFKELQEQHGVYASFSKSGYKFSLNYDQIEAKETDPLAQECRGLILSSEDGSPFQFVEINGKRNYDHICPGKTKILAYPMKRFFNYGQGCAVDINWADPNLAVLEKLDGTLCIVYLDPFIVKWCVATRSVPEADLLMDNGIFTFRTLFEKAFAETTGYDFNGPVGDLRPNWTYCFELTTPYNRIVVNYPNNGVTLLAIRDINTLKEIDPHDGMSIDLIPKMPIAQAHTYVSVDELIGWVSTLNPMEHEGVVVRDSKFNRIKVKNAAYVAYNRVRETLGASERNIMELILSEKDDDVVPFLPEEIAKNLYKIKVGTLAAIKKHDENYQAALAEANSIKPGDKKTFAVLVTKNKDLWSSPFFSMFDGKAANMREFIFNNKKEGTWANGFLDKMLEISRKV
jgi:hypothetical protein